VLGDGSQDLLELRLGDAPAQLARAREHDEPRLDVGRARGLDEPDAAEALGRVGREDLGEEGGAGFGFGVSVARGVREEREGGGGAYFWSSGEGPVEGPPLAEEEACCLSWARRALRI
jgi:hypothetical protein